MPRVSNAPSRHRRKKRLMKRAKGFYSDRRTSYRKAAETVIRAEAFATRDRRNRKRDFRRLWITRISAACRQRDLRYHEFFHRLAGRGIALNRKMLAELAVSDPQAFDDIVAAARS
jgi:large subunit ribosomal protein L20